MRHFIIVLATVLCAQLAMSQPVSYYVNDNSQAGDVYTSTTGSNTNPGTAALPFESIAHAISVAQNGDIIYVDAGTYPSNLIVNKSLSFIGARSGIAPVNTLDRGSESILVPATGNNTGGIVVVINAINITIDGFTLNGDNPAISGGFSLNGVDVNAGMGIFNQQALVDGFVLKNNIIKNFNRYGILLQKLTPEGTITENNLITSNRFDNISSLSNNGRAVAMFNNCYAAINNNHITRSVTGILFANHSVPSTKSIEVKGNLIEAYSANINFAFLGQSSHLIDISNNTIGKADPLTWNAPGSNPSLNTNGINLGVISGSGSMQLNNNVISERSNGVFTSDLNFPGGLNITGGSISNCSGVGMFLIGGNTAVTISNHSLINNVVGMDASVDFLPALQLSMSNLNITGGTTGIRFYGEALSLPGNSLGTVNFSGQSSEYIYQTSKAFKGQSLTLYNATFEGLSPSAMTLSQLFATEDKLMHQIDYDSVGYFRLRSGQVYVTQNSFKSNLPLVFGTPTTSPDINRAIGAAAAGDVINISAGVFNNEVKINKSLTLKGQGMDQTTINGPAALSSPVGFNEKSIIHTTPSPGFVSIQSLAVTGSSSDEQHAILIQGPGEVRSCEMKFVNNGIYFRDPGVVPGVAVSNGNYMHDLGYVGVNFAGSSLIAVMFNNTIDLAGSPFGMGVISGFDFGANAEFSASNNIIRNFNGWGIYSNANNGSINNNSITGTGQLLNTYMPGPVSAPCNWFGIVDAEQIYSRITGNFNISSWLTSGVDTDPLPGFQPAGGTCLGRQTRFYVNDSSRVGDVFTTAIGNNSNRGLSTQPLATIQQAIALALTGDTIYVDAGNYLPGNLSLSKSLTFIGTNHTTSPNDPSNRLNINPALAAQSRITNSLITIGASNTSFRGFTFDPQGKTQFNQLALDINNLVLENNHFLSSSAFIVISLTGRNIPVLSAHSYRILNNRFERVSAGNGSDILLNLIRSATISGNVHTVSSGAFSRIQTALTVGNASICDSLTLTGNIYNHVLGSLNISRLKYLSATFNKVQFSSGGFSISALSPDRGYFNVSDNEFENIIQTPATQYNRSTNSDSLLGANTFIFERNRIHIDATGLTGISSFGVLSNVLSNLTNIRQETFIRNNRILFTGDFNNTVLSSTTPVRISGSHHVLEVDGNEIEFSGTNLKPLPANAIPQQAVIVFTNANILGAGAIPSHAVLRFRNNRIIGYDQGIIFYSSSAATYGGLQASNILINNNSFNTLSKAINNGSTGVTINANCNWYGSAAAHIVAGSVSPNVNYYPWLINGTDAQPTVTGFQPDNTACAGTRPVITLTSFTDVTCFGAANGIINITVDSGSAPYQFSWTSEDHLQFSATTEDLNSLAPGNYKLLLTDANGSMDSIEVSISEPALLTSATGGSHVTCFNGSNGSASVTAEGGTAPYTYLWSNGATTDEINNIPAGLYSVTVTDANGCTSAATFTVNQPALLTAVATPVSTSCFNSISVLANGGTPPYTYQWSNGAANTTSISSIPSGTYSVVVTDANGCTATATATVTANEAFNPSAATTNVSCFGGNNGKITVTNVNAVAPFQYSIDGGISWQDTATFSGLSVGTYRITVKDANGCTGFVEKTISQPTEIQVSLVNVQTSCFGSSTGAATVAVSGGSPSYTYLWTGPGGFTSSQLNISNVVAGNYILKVTDSRGCVKEIIVDIPSFNQVNVSPVVTNILCKGETNGSIVLNVSGGSNAGFSYSWSGASNATTGSISNLGPGTYNVVITDLGSGCTINRSFTITQPATLVSLSVAKVNATGCSNLGRITVTASGGAGGYTYKLNGNGVYQSSNVFAGLYAGVDTVWVKDANGCTRSAVVTITDNGSDEYESNNSKTQARSISIGNIINARLALGTDVDWFKFTTPAGVSSNFTITLTHPSLVYSMNVYSSANNSPALVPVSSTAGSRTYMLNANSTYFIHVTGPLSYQCYQLTVQGALITSTRGGIEQENNKNEISVIAAKAYPNPHQGNFVLEVSSPVKEDCTVELFNAAGQSVYRKQVRLNSGRTLIPVNGMKNDMLLYRVTIGDRHLNGKILGGR